MQPSPVCLQYYVHKHAHTHGEHCLLCLIFIFSRLQEWVLWKGWKEQVTCSEFQNLSFLFYICVYIRRHTFIYMFLSMENYVPNVDNSYSSWLQFDEYGSSTVEWFISTSDTEERNRINASVDEIVEVSQIQTCKKIFWKLSTISQGNQLKLLSRPPNF